jgi:hypothetical protein
VYTLQHWAIDFLGLFQHGERFSSSDSSCKALGFAGSCAIFDAIHCSGQVSVGTYRTHLGPLTFARRGPKGLVFRTTLRVVPVQGIKLLFAFFALQIYEGGN